MCLCLSLFIPLLGTHLSFMCQGTQEISTKLFKMLFLTVKFVSVTIDWIYDNGIFIQLSLYYIVLYCIFIQHYTNIKQFFCSYFETRSHYVTQACHEFMIL